MYQPAEWHDYFITVGGGSAALTGLVFVAMTLHLEEITGDPVHRHRARTILTGFDRRLHPLRPRAHGRAEWPGRGAHPLFRKRGGPLPCWHRDDVVVHLHGDRGVASAGRRGGKEAAQAGS